MPETSFKVNVYDVEYPEDNNDPALFSDTLDTIVSSPLPERFRNLRGKGHRLEHHRMSDDCYLLNFVTLAFAGPGRSTPLQAAQPIDLQEDESFANETAVLYDPEIDLVLLESSRNGMGQGAFARYISSFSDPETAYALTPRLDDNAAARARRHQTIRSVTMRLSMGPVTELDRQSGLSTTKAMGEGYGAGTVEVTFKAERERDRSLIRDTVWQGLTPILGDRESSGVTMLKISGRENEDDPIELIDLIQHREKREFVLEIDAASRKTPHASRWETLLSARREFVN